jgi:hypothetical protein
MKDLAALRATHQRIACESRRQFLKLSGLTAGALLLSPMGKLAGRRYAHLNRVSGRP